jgi:hypothetical protein
MVKPIPTYVSPERLEQLRQLADAVRLRAALYPAPAPRPPRPPRRSRQYPGGRANPPRTARPRPPRQG